MTKISNPGTAKIFQFPVGGRVGVSGHREVLKPAAAPVAPVRIPKIQFGNNWYHEAAIEAEKARKR